MLFLFGFFVGVLITIATIIGINSRQPPLHGA